MLGKLADWFDHRTGYRKFLEAMLLEHIPGGAKWRYVWGSALAFVFMIQLITGILLMTAYSPGDSTAWGSVYFIQYEMDFGWLIRGLHHFGSQTMVVLLCLHMLQVVIAGAHLPPREVNWWLGLMLMGVVLGLSLTGYLLPWDQKGYWATRVATNIAGNIPVIGTFIQKVIVGGPDYGNATLTRFYALHVGILPATLVLLLVLHLAVFRRHGVTAPANAQGSDYFWPAQAFRDLIVCLIVFGVMLSLVIFGGHGNKIEPPAGAQGQDVSLYDEWAKAGKDGLGANLDAPADPDTAGYPARPEWYFLFLFQLLKYFEGDKILIGTVLIPNGVMAVLFLLPLVGYGRMRKFGHFLGILVVVVVLSSAAILTLLAMGDDSPKPLLFGMVGPKTAEDKVKAEGHQHRIEVAEQQARRAVQLASEGIPEQGARELLRKDPLTRGSRLFETNCTVCHKYTVRPGEMDLPGFTKGPFKASDLGEFGCESWTRGLLNNPSDHKYFGLTTLGGMKRWRKTLEKERLGMEKEDIKQQEEDFDTIAKWLDDQRNPKKNEVLAKFGLEKFRENCATCHPYGGEPKQGPDLLGYGTRDWLKLMITAPGHLRRYKNRNEEPDQMPAFRPEAISGPGTELPRLEFLDTSPGFPENRVLQLSDIDRELIIRWMTRDYRVVFGGQTISAPPKK